jgi:hypothetical protein
MVPTRSNYVSIKEHPPFAGVTGEAEGFLGPKHGIQTCLPVWEYVSRAM